MWITTAQNVVSNLLLMMITVLVAVINETGRNPMTIQPQVGLDSEQFRAMNVLELGGVLYFSTNVNIAMALDIMLILRSDNPS